jgi:very-short-patch-repair endonuclease
MLEKVHENENEWSKNRERTENKLKVYEQSNFQKLTVDFLCSTQCFFKLQDKTLIRHFLKHS